MARQNTFVPGPVVRSLVKYAGGFRANEDSALVVADGHGRFAESCARNLVWMARTVLNGTAPNANSVAPPIASSTTVISVLNPLGSGIDLEILQGWVGLGTATVNFGNGFWAWCGSYQGNSITQTPSTGTPNASGRVAGQPVCRAMVFINLALNGSRAQALIKPFPHSVFSAISSATIDQRAMVDEVNGAIVVPPGNIISLAPARIGSGSTVMAGMVWQEVTRSNGPQGEPL